MEINKPIATVIILVITLIVIFLFAWPKYQEYNDLQKQFIDKQAEYNGKSVYFQKISQILSDIQVNKSSLEKINDALPDNIEFAPLVYFLQKKGSESGLLVKSVVFSQVSSSAYAQTQAALPESASAKQVKNIPFTINVLGNYQGLKNFLYALESSSRIFEVDTISFASQGAIAGLAQKKNQVQIYDFKLSLKTHTY